MDAVIKEAARHTVVNVQTEEQSLEDLFLDYFGPDGGNPEESP